MGARAGGFGQALDLRQARRAVRTLGTMEAVSDEGGGGLWHALEASNHFVTQKARTSPE